VPPPATRRKPPRGSALPSELGRCSASDRPARRARRRGQTRPVFVRFAGSRSTKPIAEAHYPTPARHQLVYECLTGAMSTFARNECASCSAAIVASCWQRLQRLSAGTAPLEYFCKRGPPMSAAVGNRSRGSIRSTQVVETTERFKPPWSEYASRPARIANVI